MSGLEFVQGLVNGTLPILNTMAETLGYDIIEVSKGRVVVAGEPPSEAPQPFRHFYMGVFAATLLDSCMGLAVLSMLDKGLAANNP